MGATVIARPTRHLRVLPLRTLSDERLAQLASVGHSEAFETLYERYRAALSRYCRSIVRDPDDAKDALQNTMLSVLRAAQVRVPAGPIRPWLYRIAHNESISIIRRRHNHEELSVDTPALADTELVNVTRDRLDTLLVDLRSLPERQRGALVMRELGGLGYAEIANALEMSAVSARKAVFEARVALQELAVGRDTNCDAIRLQISNGDGRVLRGRGIRGHLSGCASCSAFEQGLHDRHGTFALIPAFPVISAAALLGIALPGGGGSTSGFALGGSAATGSAVGGGSVAAVKGIALSSVIAVAGAGVFVGSGIGTHAARHHRARAAVVHAQRSPRVRLQTAPVAVAVKPVHLAVAQATRAPVRAALLAGRSTSAPTVARRAPAAASAPNVRGPSVALPVSGTTPAAPTPRPTAAPPSATSTATTVASAPPTAPASANPQAAPPAPPAATGAGALVNTIIQQALQNVGAQIAAAEAQAAQAMAQAGAAPGSQTLQGILGTILRGQRG